MAHARHIHANASVHFTAGEVSTVLRSIIGVLQGDNLAPLLFIIFIPYGRVCLHFWSGMCVKD